MNTFELELKEEPLSPRLEGRSPSWSWLRWRGGFCDDLEHTGDLEQSLLISSITWG